ncbi:MAG: YHS domain-containing protein [Rhodobacteraceae bacterium]|nr:YHS domain-containing protein [Paracoccaceae bacterium]
MILKAVQNTALAAALLLAPTLAMAGPQFVDKSGYAVSGYDVVEYRNLKPVSVGQSQPQAVPGKVEFSTEWNGSKWAFASAENRDKFLANPEYYAPQYDGHCAYGASIGNDGKGGKVPGNAHLWRIVDDKLYLNINTAVVGFWEEDIPGHITKADGNWPGLEPAPSPERNAPKFDHTQAPQG